MKVVFIGSVEFSKKMLEKLITMEVEVVSVLTKESSKFNSDFEDLTTVCYQNGIEFKFIENINDDSSIQYIKEKKPDVILCFGWSQLIGEQLIQVPRLGIVGYHPTLLPYNRGRHPIIWSLCLGLDKTGSTFFFMDKDADSGDIISQREVDIEYKDDARSLYDKLTDIASCQLEEFIPMLSNNQYKVIEQDSSQSNNWRKRNQDDGRIDWRMSSYSIYNLVRALTKPYIGAHFTYKGQEIKVWRVEEVIRDNVKNIEPGKVLEVYNSNSFLVKVGDNCIKVIECNLDISVRKGEYV